MNKCKFKPNQHVVAVVNGANVTQGNMYLVNTPYTNASDIPCVSVIGDNGNLAYNYQTVFREAKLAVEESKMSIEEATLVVECKIDGCYDSYTEYGYLEVVGLEIGYFVGSEFITKIQQDKELQKALLVLMQTACCLGEGK